MWKSIVSASALTLSSSVVLATGCAASDVTDSDGKATESAVTAAATFPKVGATYEITTAFQPGIKNTLTIGANGSYVFSEQAVGEGSAALKCSGSYAALDKGRIFVGHLECESSERRFTQVVEMPASKGSLCQGIQVQVRSSLFSMQEPIPATLTEKCSKE